MATLQPTRKTQAESMNGFSAVSQSTVITTTLPASVPPMVAIRFLSANQAPTRLPTIMPEPNSAIIIGTALSGIPATSVAVEAM